MFTEIAGAVAVGILAATAVIAGIYHIVDNWNDWFSKPKKDPYALPYDVNSPLVKRFQRLAGITDKYGNMSYYRSRFNKLRYY